MRTTVRRRRDQRVFAIAIGTLAAIAMWGCIAVVAYGQVTITPPKPGLHEPVIATLTTGNQVPDGAKVRGSWDCGAAKFVEPTCVGPVAVNQIYIWAPKGTYTVRAFGIWVLTKDVTIGDQVVPVLIDFGQYDYREQLVVGGGGPDPKPDPQPGGKYRVVMFYDAAQLDNYPQAQRSLLTSLQIRQQLVSKGHELLEVLEAASIDSASESFAPFLAAVKGDPLPRIAMVPLEGGKVLDFALPGNVDLLWALLENPQ